MGNTSSTQVSFRNIVNEIKFGDDLQLVDPYEHGPGREYTATSVNSKNMVEYFAKEKPVYKTIFLTQLSNEDLAAFLNFDDIRFLRRHRPNQLALLLYKCLQQLHYFVSNHSVISDHVAAHNSIRIISNVMPYLLEDLEFEVTKPEPCDFNCPLFGARERLWLGHVSIYGKDFFANFFWRNLACSGESLTELDEAKNIRTSIPLELSETFKRDPQRPSISTCPQLPPIDPSRGVPFAHLLVRLITDLCFIPSFTINTAQWATLIDGTQGLDEAACTLSPSYPSSKASSKHPTEKQSVFVCSSLIWYDGAFMGSDADRANLRLTKLYSKSITWNRIMLLRCVLALLIERVVEGHQPADYAKPRRALDGDSAGYPYLSDLFVSSTHNPLGATLCASLLNYLASYQTKGALPWTSYVGAEVPEQLLALSTQVLNAALDFDVRASLAKPTVPYLRSDADGSTNSFWTVVDSIASPQPGYIVVDAVDSNAASYRKRLATSIRTIVANPLYALHRRIENSQKRVLCYLEVLHLLLRLLLGSSKTGSSNAGGNLLRDELTSVADAAELTEALLFFIFNGGLHHKFFAEVQVVMFILRVLIEGDAAELQGSTASSPTISYINSINKSFVFNFLLLSRQKTPYQMRPHVLGLPFVPLEGSINADLVMLSMCSMLSEATPRWYLGLAPSAAAIIKHLCGILAEANREPEIGVGLADITLFELRHSFDLVTQRNFLRKGDMAYQSAQLLLEAIEVLVTGGGTLELGVNKSTANEAASRLQSMSANELRIGHALPPSARHVSTLGALAASLGTSEGPSNLMKDWYGVRVGGETQAHKAVQISIAGDQEEMERRAATASEETKGSALTTKTALQQAIVDGSRHTVEALYVLCHNTLRPVVLAALQQETPSSSSTAGGNEAVISAKDIRVAFPSATSALCHALGDITATDERADVAMPKPSQPTPSTNGIRFAHLVSLPIALWLSQAMWTTTQSHNLRPSVLFDGRSTYMFVASAKFYGEIAENKVAKAKGALKE